mmetsp:Transcript_30504/g.101418  ORF Transcript_30504/g.101418 Transcript_30504/m.101418 type:complete len:219 (+) Transcript_30504:961-1617(+)
MVRTSQVLVQARYLATPYTNGLAATHDIAVGGPFLNDHVLKVGPMTQGGKITWDGRTILETFGDFDPEGLGKITFDDKGQLVDQAMGDLQRNIVHVNLPGNFFMQIFRWENHLNIRIRMPAAADMDGHCGNFNGDADDDDREQILARIGQQVAKPDLLFDRYTPRVPGKRLTLADCPADRLHEAQDKCSQAQDLKEGCIFDVCFAGDRYALQDGAEGW